MKTTYTTRSNEDRKHVDFGTQDKQGRNIGTRVYTFEVDFVEVPETVRMWYNQDAGHYFGLNCMATRNGRVYGASQHDQYFTNTTDRQAVIDTYLVGARKRAVGAVAR